MLNSGSLSYSDGGVEFRSNDGQTRFRFCSKKGEFSTVVGRVIVGVPFKSVLFGSTMVMGGSPKVACENDTVSCITSVERNAVKVTVPP